MKGHIVTAIDAIHTPVSIVEYAAHLAKQLHAHLLLYHVEFAASPFRVTTADIADPADLQIVDPDILEQKAAQRLDELVQMASAITDNISHEREVGFMGTKIVSRMEALSEVPREDKMLILAREEQTGFLDEVFGTATSDIVKSVTCPVLVVPRDSVYRPLEHLLYIIEHGKLAPENVDYLAQIARYTDAQISVVYLTDQDNHYSTEEMEVKKYNIQQVVDYERINFYRYFVTEAFDGIQEVAGKNGVDMVGVSRLNKGFFTRLFGDHENTNAYILQSPVPILLF